MDTTSEQVDGDKVFTREAYSELLKRLEKAEGKLEKAKTRAQATMQEIWQLDHRLKEEEERANKAEAQLAEMLGTSQGTSILTDEADEWSRARLDGLRIQLHEAEVRAQEAERKLDGVSSSAGVFSEQLSEIQLRLREAEEKALDWEERFHRSQELASQSEASIELQNELTLKIADLEGQLTHARELELELEEARARVASLEASLASVPNNGEDGPHDRELMAHHRERLELAEERVSLLERKATHAEEKVVVLEKELEHSQNSYEELRQRFTQAAAVDAEHRLQLHKAQEALALAEARASQAPSSMQGALSLNLSDDAMHAKIQEAQKKTREAELKAGQAELQLQKAIASLKEYEQRANESDRETQRLAFQDSLTGLPNLNLIRQYLDFTVKQVQRYQRASALLILDLDRFKLINDAMGMKAGDDLLVQVAERLQNAIRESDALGRRGEDEFLILLSELVTGDDSVTEEQKTHMIRQSIAIVVNRISEGLSRPFVVQGQKFYVRASIGVSICPNDADSAQAMLEHADCAVGHAKESGRGRCVFYNSELHKRQERRLAMDSQLRLALERGEFSLVYQPILEVAKGKGHVVGVEALVRWNHRMEGLLSPHQFLPAAEESGAIVPLGYWVFRQACWQLRQWLSAGANLFMAINVSTRQMMQADLAEVILGSVEEFGLQPGLICIEIAEGTSIEEVDLVEKAVTNLGRVGVRVSIDDFGSGYHSLSRLDLQHLQFLKVAPELVAGVQQDKVKANLCEGAIRLAQTLELKPLAEGVETMAQAKFLSKIGCPFMQGFYLHEPVQASEITNLLAERRVWKF